MKPLWGIAWRTGKSPGLATEAGELVPGFLDRRAQRGVTGQRVAGDPDGSRGDVDVDPGNPGEPADLGPDGAGAVVAGHAGNSNGTSRHVHHRKARVSRLRRRVVHEVPWAKTEDTSVPCPSSSGGGMPIDAPVTGPGTP